MKQWTGQRDYSLTPFVDRSNHTVKPAYTYTVNKFNSKSVDNLHSEKQLTLNPSNGRQIIGASPYDLE